MVITNPNKVSLLFEDDPGRGHFIQIVKNLIDVSYTLAHLGRQLGYTNSARSSNVKDMLKYGKITLYKLDRIYDLYVVNNRNEDITREYGEQVPPIRKLDLIREASKISVAGRNGWSEIRLDDLMSYLKSRGESV